MRWEMGGVYPLSMIRASFLHRIIQKCPLWANTEFEQATIEFRVIPGTDRDIYVWLTLNNCPTASYRTLHQWAVVFNNTWFWIRNEISSTGHLCQESLMAELPSKTVNLFLAVVIRLVVWYWWHAFCDMRQFASTHRIIRSVGFSRCKCSSQSTDTSLQGTAIPN